MSFPYQSEYDLSSNINNQNNFQSQIPPYYFYFNPTNIVYQPFLFTKRISRLDFEMMGRVDVNRISSTGDIQSVMQLLSPIVFANITQVEANEFGSRGALHSFMILQMAVEYYLNVVGKLTWEISHLQKALKKNNKIPPNYDQRVISNYVSQIQILKNDVEKRDLIIDNLSEKYSNVRHERDLLKAQLDSFKKNHIFRVLRPDEFENDELSEGELDLSKNLKPSTNSLEPKTSSKNRSPRSSSKSRQKPSQNLKEKYDDLNSKSYTNQNYSDEEYKESSLSSKNDYYYSSSSGWT